MKQINKLSSIKNLCIGFGMIPTAYTESLSYYETLLWLCKFIEEKMINTINDNTEAVEELQQLYTQLKTYVDNYFKDLDIQSEINRKLDEMAESGQLADIISQYLRVSCVLAYNTVADLSQANNVVNGSICRTLGFKDIKDDEGAYYKIRTYTVDDVIDGYKIVELDNSNTLIAERLIPNRNYEDHFRYYIDGINGDDSNDGKSEQTAFKTLDRFLNVSNEKRNDLRCYIISAGTYLIEKTNVVNTQIHITGNADGVIIESRKNECVFYNSHVNLENITFNNTETNIPYYEDCSVVLNNVVLNKPVQFYNCMLTLQNSTINEIRLNQCEYYFYNIIIDGKSKSTWNTPLNITRGSNGELNGTITYKTLTEEDVTLLMNIYGGTHANHATFVFENQDSYNYGDLTLSYCYFGLNETNYYQLIDNGYHLAGNKYTIPAIKIRNEDINLIIGNSVIRNHSYFNGESVVLNFSVSGVNIETTGTIDLLTIPAYLASDSNVVITNNSKIGTYAWIINAGTIKCQFASTASNRELRIDANYHL